MKTTKNIGEATRASVTVLAVIALATPPSQMPSTSDARQLFPSTAHLPPSPTLTLNEYLIAQYGAIYQRPDRQERLTTSK